MRLRVLVSAALFGCLVSGSAAADPQANASWIVGAAGQSKGGDLWSTTRFALGLQGDVLFGRSRNADFGFGPYVEGLTSFNDLEAGAGGSALLPVHPYLPVVLSLGGYGRHDADGKWEPGVAAQLFWGSRSYNFDSSYVMAGGLHLEFRQGLGDTPARTVLVAAQLDAAVLMIPWIFAYELVSGSPD